MKKLVFENRADIIGLSILAGIAVVAVALQQLLPADKPLPYARLNGSFQRIQSADTVTSLYSTILGEKLTIQAGDETYSYRISDLGISLNKKKSLAGLYPESRLRRLVPFSTLVQANNPHLPYYASNKKSLSIVTSEIASKAKQPSQDSSLQIIQGTLLATPAHPGTSVEKKVLASYILDAVGRRQSVVKVDLKQTEPSLTTAALTKAIDSFTASIPTELNIMVEDTTVILPKSEITSWAKVDKTTPALIVFDQEKVDAYAQKIAEANFTSQAATPTIITIEDGKETGRVVGVPGKSIDSTELSKSITAALASKSTTVTAHLVDAVSPISFKRTYTKSSQGLRDLMAQLTSNRAISIHYSDINDRGWDVDSGGETEFQMASTYKLFVAYSVLLRIDSGEFSWADTVADTDASTCFDLMIVNSDNACALAFAERIGWAEIENEGRAIGATGLNWTDDVNGTANDVAALLSEIAKGSVLTAASRKVLIDDMKTQVYREGIPAGTTYDVADKVGFQDAILHDGAIIYAPNLTHVLVIFTNDSTWAEIAEITRQIEAIVQ